jgi:acetoin utilization deacetylase AcuC-like enzyme
MRAGVRWWRQSRCHPQQALAAPDAPPVTLPTRRSRYYAFDLSAPIVEKTWHASVASASSAYAAADAIYAGERHTYARCRPPGHHAGRDVWRLLLSQQCGAGYSI